MARLTFPSRVLEVILYITLREEGSGFVPFSFFFLLLRGSSLVGILSSIGRMVKPKPKANPGPAVRSATRNMMRDVGYNPYDTLSGLSKAGKKLASTPAGKKVIASDKPKSYFEYNASKVKKK